MKKKFDVAIYLNAIVVCLGLACSVITMINATKYVSTYLAMSIVEICMYILICIYAFIGYKKPHGNLLRYLMFTFGLTLMARLHICATTGETKSIILYTVSIALISYMSGRLNKIEKNKYIAVVVLLMLCHCAHSGIVTFEETNPGVIIDFTSRINMYIPAFLWIALSSAYFTRFLQHKEAGLTDK